MRTAVRYVPSGFAPVFLNSIRLTHVYIASWGVWLAALIISASRPYSGQTATAWLVVLASAAAVLIGLMVFESKPKLLKQPQMSGAAVTRLQVCVLIATGFGALGVLLRAYDWFVVRGVEITGALMTNREALLQSSGPISVAAAALIPFTIVAPVINGLMRRHGHSMVLPVTSLLLASAAPLMAIAIGSRSSLLYLGIVYVLCALHYFRLNAKLFGTVAAGAFALFIISTIVFVARANDMGMDIPYSARYSIFTQMVPTREDVLHALDTAPQNIKAVLFGMISLAQYLCHGVFEATYIVDYFNPSEHSNGLYTFEFAIKAANLLPVIDFQLDHLGRINPRQGAFATLFGVFYIDFGAYGIIACFIFGVLASLIRSRAVSGDWTIAPLYMVVAAQVAMAVVADPFGTAAMIYWDMALVVFWLAARAFVFGPEPARAMTWRRPA
jgi:hypothetical protein